MELRIILGVDNDFTKAENNDIDKGAKLSQC